ncbi:MAG: ion transporter, partial [Hyphococcus sp.]
MNDTQNRIAALVESRWFQTTVLVLIIANAVILGAETFAGVRARAGAVLAVIDRIIIYAFVAEIALRMYAEGVSYFRKGWNLFDFAIVTVSLLAATSGLGALRAFRVLRVLRVITVMPRMRVVVSALLDSIPGIASVGVVLVLILYVFAVIAATLYGGEHPEIFGNVFTSMYTLFTVMTLEGWREIADAVAATHPRSWVFFLTFVLIATFTMLNLFVAIVVRVIEEDSDELMTTQTDRLHEDILALREDVAALRREI